MTKDQIIRAIEEKKLDLRHVELEIGAPLIAIDRATNVAEKRAAEVRFNRMSDLQRTLAGEIVGLKDTLKNMIKGGDELILFPDTMTTEVYDRLLVADGELIYQCNKAIWSRYYHTIEHCNVRWIVDQLRGKYWNGTDMAALLIAAMVEKAGCRVSIAFELVPALV